MSRQITDEHIKFSIIVNGDPAQKELLDLEKATRKLNEEQKQNILQRKELEKQGKKDTAEYIALTNKIKENSAAVEVNKDKMFELQRQLGLMSLSANQLNQKAMVLRMTLKNLVPGSEDYERYKAQLTAVQNRISELNGKAQASKLSISSMADSFNKYQGLALSAVATLTGVVFSVQKIIDINGKLSDSQADVMKTTGMNKKEVDELTKSFGALETRTSRIDLLKIAEQGGRIGIAKSEIGDFVNVMNKAAVALGDSFTGGAEEVSNKLGKIKFLFEETKNLNVDKAYNAIGSAINDLGANGVASEANIAEFTTRIGSLTDVLKPTIQETLALGTAFEESGIEAEVSARAYNIFMKQASTESAKFAQVMGISQKSVEDMINTNPLDFMMKFAEGMRGMDATETAKTLDFLGVNADGANKVIGAMGNNMARFRELIDLSNNSFASGTSLVNEYNVKNENLAATLEKISKKVSGWFSSETFIQYLGGLVSWFGKFIGATEDADGSVTAWKNTLFFTAKIIAVVTAALVTNVGWQKLVALWTTRSAEGTMLYNAAEKARAFITGISTIATQAQAVAVAWATGNTIALKEAQIALGLAMKTTPFGFVLSAIAAIVVAYEMFSKQVDNAAKVQKTLSDIQAETAKNAEKEISALEQLTKIAQDETLSKEKRLAAIKELNDLIPDYIGNLTLENIKNAEGIDILKKYTEEIYKNARAKSIAKKYQELSDQRVDVENKSLSSYQNGAQSFFKNIPENLKGEKDIWKQAYQLTQQQLDQNGKKFIEGTVAFYRQTKFNESNILARLSSVLKDKNEELAGIDAQMKALEPEVLKNKINDLGPKEGDTKIENGVTYEYKGGKWVKVKSNYNSNLGGGSDGKNGSKKYDDSYLSDEQKRAEELFALQKKLEEQRIAMMQDGYEKDLALEKLNTNARIQELKFQNEAVISLDKKLDKDLTQAKKDGDQKKIVSIENQKKLLLEKQKALNELICYEEETQKIRIGIIEEKGANAALKKAKDNFEQAKILRETAYNEQLAALGNNEAAKAKLKKEFEATELAEQEKFLRELIDKFNTIVGKGKFAQMDMSLLTPEQVAEFTAEAQKVGLTLSELIAKKNELSGGGNENFSALGLKGASDIFGFSPDNWQQFYDNLQAGKFGVDEMAFAVQALTDVWSKYGQLVTANENAQLKRFELSTEAKKKKLKSQLDAGMISQTYYNRHIEKLDKDLDRQKAELAYKQAKRQRGIDIAQAISGTAQAVIGALGNKPWTPFNFVLAGLVGAMGALQLGTILATPLPAKGYEKGLYGDYVKREQDGKVFQAQYGGTTKSGVVTRPTYFLTGENGPEMIIDKRAYASLSSGTRDSLLRELRGIKGYEQGLYNQQTKRYEVPATTQAPSQSTTASGDVQMLMDVILANSAIISENLAVMKDLRDQGVFVTNKDLQSMKNLRDGIKAYEDLRTKAKQ